MVSALSILILGGAGVQNSYVARDLVKAGHKVRLLSRNPQNEEPASLAALGVEVIAADTYDEDALVSAFKDIDSVFVNTNGFAIGEKSEIYWGIRIYEIAHWAGVKHFIYSALPYVSKKSSFNPKYRVPFTDGKAKVAEYLKSQPTDQMNWSILESGPYAENFLLYSLAPQLDDETGEYVYRAYLGEQGSMALVSLAELGWFARYMFEHPEEFRGDLLSVGIQHVTGKMMAEAFTAVTGHKARYEPITRDQMESRLVPKKIGTSHSPGYDDPTLVTQREMFVPWWTIWNESHGNVGLWTRDYERLDKIKPDRLKTVEQWLRSVDYKVENELKPVLKSDFAWAK
ncbi:hypothetical protein BGZ63DRAFT_359652 [Mariannaea sp. PMI_226]|nr:hypothetical protein BGZ63DRAFT_359652 [Mariannaea sp. PMI_226]